MEVLNYSVDNANDFVNNYILSEETKENIHFLNQQGEQHILTMNVKVRETVVSKVTDDFFD